MGGAGLWHRHAGIDIDIDTDIDIDLDIVVTDIESIANTTVTDTDYTHIRSRVSPRVAHVCKGLGVSSTRIPLRRSRRPTTAKSGSPLREPRRHC